jgi:hypothetical protein
MNDVTDDTPAEAGAGGGKETADLETVEVITAEVEEDGTIVIDDLVAEVDRDGNIVATDELVEVDLPDGTVIFDETFSVADEDGDLVTIDEDTTIVTPDEEVPAGAKAEAAPEPPAPAATEG